MGDENTHEDLVVELLELEHDSLAAYDTAIERLEDGTFVASMRAFRADHERRLVLLEEVAASLGLKVPDGSLKSVLMSGKVVLAGLSGDRAILSAMGMNEAYAAKVYERASGSARASEATRGLSREAGADGRRHRVWISRTVAALDDEHPK